MDGGRRYRRHVHRPYRRRAEHAANCAAPRCRRCRAIRRPRCSTRWTSCSPTASRPPISRCSCTARRSRPTRCSKARACGPGLLITQGLPRRLRGARLVAAARQRPARHVLPEAAAAGAAVADRGGDASGSIIEARCVTPLDEAGVARARCAGSKREGRRGDRRVLPVLLPQSRRTSGAPPRSSPRRRRTAASRCPRAVLPVIREYPRLSTTVIDAYVGPKIADYLLRLERAPRRARRDDAAAISDAVERRPDAHLARRASSQPDAAVGAGGRRHRRRRAGARRPSARHSSPSTWAAPRPTSASSSTARVLETTAGPDRGPGHRHADAARAHAGRGRRHASPGSARTAC